MEQEVTMQEIMNLIEDCEGEFLITVELGDAHEYLIPAKQESYVRAMQPHLARAGLKVSKVKEEAANEKGKTIQA